MKLIEALQAVNAAKARPGPSRTVFLACGCTPLHLGTFLSAHLTERRSGYQFTIDTGIYGSLAGNLDRARQSDSSGIAAVVEWSDLDPRLGLRTSGGWSPTTMQDVVLTARASLAQLADRLITLAAEKPLVLAMPTLPLPPVWHTAGNQASVLELELRAAAADVAARLAATPGIRVLSSQRLDSLSPLARRRDARGEIAHDIPYTSEHTDHLTSLLADLLAGRPVRKGLITDLDDTLWRGLLGEVGIEGISCTLDGGAQVHGLYQQLLASLADSGVLIGIASKNDRDLVERALEHADLYIESRQIFPIEAHWGAKSESVARILERWNVAPDSIVFVDDSPIELAEVAARFPDVECVRFPREDPSAVVDVLYRLRDLFGKPSLTEDDAIRLDSIRRSGQIQPGGSSSVEMDEAFLQALEAELTFDFSRNPIDPRPLELLNKTNQFNLNGRRFTESEWSTLLKELSGFSLTVSYRDKFGALGKIGVVTGHAEDGVVTVESWVLSCRAFARRIEHRTLQELFDQFAATSVALDFQRTERNTPLQEFLNEMVDEPWPVPIKLTREEFFLRCRPTYHAVNTILTAATPHHDSPPHA